MYPPGGQRTPNVNNRVKIRIQVNLGTKLVGPTLHGFTEETGFEFTLKISRISTTEKRGRG